MLIGTTTLDNNTSFTKSDVSIHIGKDWIAIDSLLTIRKSNPFNKMKKRGILPSSKTWAAPLTLMKQLEKKWEMNYTRIVVVVLFWTNPGSYNPQNSSCTATYSPVYKPSKMNKIYRSPFEKQGLWHYVGGPPSRRSLSLFWSETKGLGLEISDETGSGWGKAGLREAIEGQLEKEPREGSWWRETQRGIENGQQKEPVKMS